MCADGRYSKTTRLLQEQVPGFRSEVKRSDRQYMSFSGISADLPGLPVFRTSEGLGLKAFSSISQGETQQEASCEACTCLPACLRWLALLLQ